MLLVGIRSLNGSGISFKTLWTNAQSQKMNLHKGLTGKIILVPTWCFTIIWLVQNWIGQRSWRYRHSMSDFLSISHNNSRTQIGTFSFQTDILRSSEGQWLLGCLCPDESLPCNKFVHGKGAEFMASFPLLHCYSGRSEWWPSEGTLDSCSALHMGVSNNTSTTFNFLKDSKTWHALHHWSKSSGLESCCAQPGMVFGKSNSHFPGFPIIASCFIKHVLICKSHTIWSKC